jgi:uncharacterized repeat protein (TIGR01451 family)
MKQFAASGRLLRSVILSVAVLLICTIPVSAQVVFDAASNASPATASTATAINVSWNHTIGLAKKEYLVVGVSMKLSGGGATVASVTYGTEAGGPSTSTDLASFTMVNLGAVSNGTAARVELWGIAGPAPGTHQITVAITNGGGQNVAVVAGAKSFSNVFQTAANGTAVTATNNSTTPSVVVANSAFDYVVDAVAFNGNNALTAGASQTNTYNLTSAAPVFSGAGSSKTGFANTTMSWTSGAAAQWAIAAVPLHSANPQILFDAASSLAAATVAATNPVNVSWSHSTTTAANRYIVVAVTFQMGNGTGASVASATYGTEGGGPNQALLLLGAQTSANNHVRVELWGNTAPASGTHTITVSVANTSTRTLAIAAGAQSFSNVDQNTPHGTAAGALNTSANPAVAVTNSAYDYVVDGVAYDANVGLSPGPTQDQRYQLINAGAPAFTGAMSGSRGYTNTTMQWVGANSVRWAIEAVPLKQVTMALTKTASADVVKVGTTVTYTLTATNYTAASQATVTITDAIPAGSTFVQQTGCGGTGPVTCNVGPLAAGATSAPITITVVPNTAGTISNVATVTYTGSPIANSSETVKSVAEGKVCATPGKDGAGNTLAGIVNDYWIGSASVAAGATGITLGARAAGAGGKTIAAGDLLIVMQMQDAAFNTTNDETYGEGTGSTQATGTGSGAATTLNNAGRWEYAVATNAVGTAGGALTLNGGGLGGGLLYSYTSQTFAATTTQGQRTFQVIRVPQYTTATLGSTLTALPWNCTVPPATFGCTGGVLAVDVSGTMTLGGATVAVDGLGFRGGGGRVLDGDGGTPTLLNTDFATLATRTSNGSKGEGIAGTPRYVYQSGATIGAPGVNAPLDTTVEGYVGGSYGRGGPGNGGGGSTDGDPATAPNGGNDENSGGGGGGNGGNGGSGGNGWQCNCPGGGQGGGNISPSLTRIALGGGGGAGTSNNGSAADATGNVLADTGAGTVSATATGYYSSGADGGGIIIMRALQATGAATLTANGLNGPNTGRDGPGGGGAGGSVLFTTQLGTLAGLTIQAQGGNGGSAWILTPAGGDPGERHGPGGGGGGGYVLTSSAPASTNVNGGINGVTTASLSSYGAQPGSPGIVQLITGNNVLPGGDGASCAIADLAVTNVASPSPAVQAGNNLTYTQTVTNNGPSSADGVVYMAPIPASATFVSMSVPAGWTCITPAVGATGVVTCTTPTLANAATANFSLVVNTVTGTPAGYVMTETNSVSSNTPDSNPANNQATATTIVEASATADLFADMAVTISQSTNYPTAGSNINYTQTISNLGSFTANTPTYTFTTPPNTTFQSLGAPPAGWTCITPAIGGTGTINCSGGTLASGASFSLPLTLKVNAGTGVGTAITATPSVASSSREPYLPNNTASVTSTVVAAGSGDVGITISNSPDPVSPAENYTYTVVATNGGPAAAANVIVTIPVPPGANFQSLTTPGGWACVPPAVGSAGNITCTIASLGIGASATFSPVVQVNAGTASGTTLTSMASITTTSTDNIAGNNNATATNLVTSSSNADMAITKTDSPDPVGQGQLITYRLTVTNNGPAIATNVTVSDPLDASLTLNSATPSIGSCAGATTVTCTLGTLNVGDSQFINIIVQATATGTISNTATVTATQTDPVPANNSATTTTTVLAVTLARVRNFEATQENQDVLVTWITSFESDNLGFNVYREADGVRTKLNRGLIAGTALSAGTQTQTHGYRLRDRLDTAGAQAQYYLEDVDTHGKRTLHGPISPSFGSVGQTTTDAPMLSRVGQSSGQSSNGFTVRVASNSSPMPGLGQQGSVLESQPGMGVDRPLTIAPPAKNQSERQQQLAAQNGLKIYVTAEGWQRVTRAAMLAAGFDPGPDMGALGLYSIGLVQPFVAEADAIDFYGFPLDTVSTGARTYWLRNENGNGKKYPSPGAGGGATLNGDVAFTYRRTERTIYFAGLNNNGDDTDMFGPILTTDPTTQTFSLTGVDTAYTGNASISLTVQGAIDTVTHMIDVTVNGHHAGVVSVPRIQEGTSSLPLLQSWLVNGPNDLVMTAQNGDDDVSVLVSTTVTYQHALHADNGAFEATLPSGRNAVISGFTSSNVVGLDVTDPANPAMVTTTTASDGAGGWTATLAVPFSGSSSTHVILAVDASRNITPGELALNQPSTLSASDTPGGDLVIIANSAFASSASPLVSTRSGQGLTPVVVNVDDVYDEYNFGIRDPQAIRSFLQDSLKKWKKSPRWVLLLGSASIDPRNFLGSGAFDFVPTRLLNMSLMKTASDDWFTDFNNDGIADLAIGRIPVRTASDAALVINRIATRGTPSGAWANHVVFVADQPDTYDFPGVVNSLASMLPGSMTSQVIRYDQSSNPTGDTVAAFNSGALIADYVGHGSTEIWSDGRFSSANAAALSNGSNLPVAILMTCLNGYFHDIDTESLATALLTAPNGGAIAVWASSTLTEPDQQAAMNRELFRLLFSDPTLTLGEAVLRAKRVSSDTDVQRSWIFFGDPSMKLGNTVTGPPPATATHFLVSAPANAGSGAGFNITVTALDASNAVAAGYRGTVRFTSSGAGTLPPNYTFTSADNGVHPFGLTLTTSGPQTVTATDTTTQTISGSASVSVGCGGFSVSASNSGPACVGGSVQLSASTSATGATFAWTGPGGFTSVQQNPSVTVGGSYTVTVSVSGCQVSSSTNVVITNAPAITILGASTACASTTGNTASITSAGPGATYTWTVLGGGVTSGAGTNSITYQVYGFGTVTVSVAVKTAGGCAGSASKVVTINPAPSVSIPPSIAVCGPQTINIPLTLAGTAPWTVYWSDGNVQSINSATASRSFNATGPAVLGILYITDATCSRSAPSANVLQITVDTPPVITTQPANSSVSPATFSVTATGTNLHYQWYQEDTTGTVKPVGSDGPFFFIPDVKENSTIWVDVFNGCARVESIHALSTPPSKPRPVGH